MRVGFISFAVTAAILAALASYKYHVDQPPDFGIEYQQANERLILAWDDQDAVLYEIQARQFTGDWHTIAWTRGTWVGMTTPLGVSQMRLRAWDIDGPRRWCRPTDFLFVFQVTPPPAEPDGELG